MSGGKSLNAIASASTKITTNNGIDEIICIDADKAILIKWFMLQLKYKCFRKPKDQNVGI